MYTNQFEHDGHNFQTVTQESDQDRKASNKGTTEAITIIICNRHTHTRTKRQMCDK